MNFIFCTLDNNKYIVLMANPSYKINMYFVLTRILVITLE